jgi:hypothetical protein
VFVVSQVDGEGYVLPDKFVETIKSLYTEDALKTIVQKMAPDCCTNANAGAKGKCKTERI